jgi:hypothetical protein
MKQSGSFGSRKSSETTASGECVISDPGRRVPQDCGRLVQQRIATPRLDNKARYRGYCEVADDTNDQK